MGDCKGKSGSSLDRVGMGQQRPAIWAGKSHGTAAGKSQGTAAPQATSNAGDERDLHGLDNDKMRATGASWKTAGFGRRRGRRRRGRGARLRGLQLLLSPARTRAGASGGRGGGGGSWRRGGVRGGGAESGGGAAYGGGRRDGPEKAGGGAANGGGRWRREGRREERRARGQGIGLGAVWPFGGTSFFVWASAFGGLKAAKAEAEAQTNGA
nr:glycine-rich cell wall structural protein 1-like [Lolium perenne]